MNRSRPRPVLVLGGSGFLGTHVIEAVLAGGWSVVEAGRSASRAQLPPDAPGRTEHEAFDAREPGGLEVLVRRVRPAGIVNCAALSRGGDNERDRDLATTLNTDLPALLGRCGARWGIHVIHVSTDLVFAGTPPLPGGYREEDPTASPSVYGRTKAAGEVSLLEADPSALVVRLPLLFGDSRGRGLGASDSVLRAIERDDERPQLFVDEYRTPLAVEEAAGALVELLELERRGLLHVAGPERLSRYELGFLVALGAGFSEVEIDSLLRPVRLVDLDLRPPRPTDVSLDSRRARESLRSPLSAPRDLLRPPPPPEGVGAP